MDYAKYLEMLNKLLTIIGNVTIEEAKTWAEVKANAEALVEETGSDDTPVSGGS